MTRLPTNPTARVAALVRRSAPSPKAPTLPNLPPDIIASIHEADRRRAALYAQFEDATDRCLALAEAIEASGVVIDVIDPGEEDSLVISLDGVLDAATAYGH
mgnify:CR=1 FL=1